jgi:N4-(beta-N-acetylglucosaminyl)-L-asparaginase
MKLQGRRAFLESLSTIGLGLLISCKSKTEIGNNKGVRPIAVTTWDADMSVNTKVWETLSAHRSALDAVESGAVYIEGTTNCCVGLGGNPDRDGRVTLDASIMDHNHNCGSVCYVQRVAHPISLARMVMEKSPHVMLVGDGAEKFAQENNIALINPKLSQDAEKEYKKWLEKSEYKPQKNIEKNQNTNVPSKLSNGNYNHDTMGILAIDQDGKIAGACTTSGMGFKMAGRVGDSPIIGSGLYVDGKVGAAVASGQGEEVIRICGTHLVVENMRQGKSPTEACRLAVLRIIDINPQKAKDFQVGFLAINLHGEHGAFAIHEGFTYAITNSKGIKEVIKAKFVI